MSTLLVVVVLAFGLWTYYVGIKQYHRICKLTVRNRAYEDCLEHISKEGWHSLLLGGCNEASAFCPKCLAYQALYNYRLDQQAGTIVHIESKGTTDSGTIG